MTEAEKFALSANGYLIPVTCPTCGSAMIHRASGVVEAADRHTKAVMDCSNDECASEWILSVTLVQSRQRARAPKIRNDSRVAECGTDSGYYRHIRTLKEEACMACKGAHTTAENARSANRRVVGVS